MMTLVETIAAGVIVIECTIRKLSSVSTRLIRAK